EIAVIRLALGVALRDRTSDRLANRPAPGAVGVFPGQPILLARRTDDLLRVLVHAVALAASERVVLLCIDVTATNRNRVQFIGANAAVEELLAAGCCVERPPARSLHDWNGERPVLVADEEERSGLVFRIQRDALLLADFR